jgi:hypothetical protein
VTTADCVVLVNTVLSCFALVFLGWLWSQMRMCRRCDMNAMLSKFYLRESRKKTEHADRMYLLGRSTGVLDADLVHLGRSIQHVSKDVGDPSAP